MPRNGNGGKKQYIRFVPGQDRHGRSDINLFALKREINGVALTRGT